MNDNGKTYFAFKRLLFTLKDYSDRINGGEANGMIYDACEAAIETLDDADRAHVEEAIDRLMERMGGTRTFGRRAALELLASIAWYV